VRIFGQFKIGAPVVQHSDVTRVDSHVAPDDAYVAKLSAYLDGQGGGGVSQKARGVVYDRNNVLLGTGSEVSIVAGAPPGWVDFPFANPPKVSKGQVVKLGLQFGDTNGTIRSYQLASQGAGGEEQYPMATITASGNELTDATRAVVLGLTSSGQQMSALAAPTSIVTNLCTNGGFEVDAAGWSGSGSGGTTSFVRSTADAKFGSACLDLTASGAAVGRGVRFGIVYGLQTQYTVSFWYKAVQIGVGATPILMATYNSPQVTTQVSLSTALDGVWRQASVTFVTDGTSQTLSYAELRFNGTITSGTYEYRIDGVQIEYGAVVNTYVETAGAIATRTVAAPADSSYGIRRAATNLFTRGQADAVSTAWGNAGAGTVIAIDATSPAPFSPQSMKYTCDGTAANQGCLAQSGTGLAATVGTPGVGSIWFKGIAGRSYFSQMRWINTDATTTDGAQSVFTATGTWQLLTPAAVNVAATKTGNQLIIMARVNGTRADAFWVAHAMLETGFVAGAPYVATFGGTTATHAAGRVQVPAQLVGATRGWFAVRRRMGNASTVGAGQQNSVWWGSGSVYIALYNSNANFYMDNSDNSASVVQAYVAGDELTIIGFWTPTQIGISINGGAFVTASTSAPPNPVQTLIDIGRDTVSASNWMEGDLAWFACGTGTPTNADAAAIHANGHVDPVLDALPAAATAMWPAQTGVYETYVDAVATSGAYPSGAPNPLAAQEAHADQRSLFASYVKAWALPPNVDDFYIARLPWEASQSVFGNGGVLALPIFHADVGWHGTDLDDEEGAFAIVQEGSVLEALIGERVRIRTDQLSAGVVFAFVHNRYPIVDDISLTRRAFLELGFLAADNVRCVIEVMG
jgi:hypothetical protein